MQKKFDVCSELKKRNYLIVFHFNFQNFALGRCAKNDTAAAEHLEVAVAERKKQPRGC